MSKESGVIILGIFVAILTFLGFPQAWREIFFIISGLGIAVLGFLLRADHLRREQEPGSAHGAHYPFVESAGKRRMADISGASAAAASEDSLTQ